MRKTTKFNLSIVYVLIFTALFILSGILVTPPAHADMGPKPSVVVRFENMPDEPCYATLLSRHENTGPNSAWDGKEESKFNYGRIKDETDRAVWQAFADYKDADGYFYLQMNWNVRKTPTLDWTYYPPNKFKILLYFPERDVFAASGKYESYAFHSYFAVNMKSLAVSQDAPTRITANRAYDYTWEIISLIGRIIATIAIELGIAWLFKFRKKFQILTILTVNCITQIALNIILYLVNYFSGGLTMLLVYLPAELFIFFIEAMVYGLMFTRRANVGDTSLYASSDRTGSLGYCIAYSFCANALSFVFGFVLSLALPNMF